MPYGLIKGANKLGASLPDGEADPQGMEKGKTVIIAMRSRVLGRELNPQWGIKSY